LITLQRHKKLGIIVPYPKRGRSYVLQLGVTPGHFLVTTDKERFDRIMKRTRTVVLKSREEIEQERKVKKMAKKKRGRPVANGANGADLTTKKQLRTARRAARRAAKRLARVITAATAAMKLLAAVDG
jgi:TRAP-type C4-dicarboxylate transport system substrate-binding protein